MTTTTQSTTPKLEEEVCQAMEALVVRADRLLAAHIGGSKSVHALDNSSEQDRARKAQEKQRLSALKRFRADRIQLAQDVVDFLSGKFSERESLLTAKWDAIEKQIEKTRREIGRIEKLEEKGLEDCLKISGLNLFAKELALRQGRLRKDVSEADMDVLDLLKRLATSTIHLARYDAVDALVDRIVAIIRPFSGGNEWETVAIARKMPAVVANDLKFRSRDLVSSPNIIPEAAAQVIRELLEYQIKIAASAE